ncbi:MAG: RNA-binding transcriptional accessory protein [FCB group bacterium]|nr:RNA-binding transcriptional accessory protein [FCB group bacterium]
MQEVNFTKISEELSIKVNQVKAVSSLLDAGGTIPFIARYRKEATDCLDEVAITTIRDRLAQLKDLDLRRSAILKSLEERELLTDELKVKIDGAETMAVLEDIYLPFRPKRRTRATMAREKGLGPLAERIFPQEDLREAAALEAAAAEFIDEEKGVPSKEEALAGARDIMAEMMSEDTQARAMMRELFERKGFLHAQVLAGKEEDGQKYRDYFDWEEPLSEAPSHRVLAIRRGENEDILSLRLQPPEEEALALLEGLFIKADHAGSREVQAALVDSYKRLLGPSMETEARQHSKVKADIEAIKVFVENLRQLLLSAPYGQRAIMAIDPGFRTGCKLVCLDPQGKLLHHDVIYPHFGTGKSEEAGRKVAELCQRFAIEAIAVGNGTAGRETMAFLTDLQFDNKPSVTMVNESGASIYSASEVAREEFPDHDVTVRGAVSIGRRLQDPLAELVKIDPKSIGVGQYQHDVNQADLRRSLDDVVSSCVNAVGVEVNTASKQLLTYISGLGPQLAQNIIDYRDNEGPFQTRKDLKKVTRLGAKAFEQSAGFLRIRSGPNPLDASAVHPESYKVVEAMAKDLDCQVEGLLQDPESRAGIQLNQYVSDKVGMPTLQDIMSELAKPGRDPRESFEAFQFTDGVNELADLKVGMRLTGKVTNITKFGAFVDVGVHQDGLVHISQMADRFIKDPAEVVKLDQTVAVTVLEVDLQRRRVSLSMKEGRSQEKGDQPKSRPAKKPAKKETPRRPPKLASKPPAQKLDPNNPFVQAFQKANLVDKG